MAWECTKCEAQNDDHEDDMECNECGQPRVSDKPVVKLLGRDGNAFAILGTCAQVARKNKMDWATIQKEMMSGDYDHLLATAMKYFEVR